MHYVILGTFLPSRELSICNNLYFGYFQIEATTGIPNGELKDKDGMSVIGEVVLENNRFEFTQVREDGDDRIRYSFQREGTIWKGTYSGGKHGTGYTKCILNPVQLNFLAS